MTRVQTAFAALCLAAIVAVVPAASAQSVHFVGAGSSAQFLTSALGADILALKKITNDGNVGTKCTFHNVASSNSLITDTRDSRIQAEPGNTWLVWIGDCADSTGNTGVTDIWLMSSVDSTVGVRTFLAQEAAGAANSGAQVTVTGKVSNGSIATALWSDNKADVTSVGVTNVLNPINAGGGVHVNAGLTDIRPEDALYATTRSLGTLNTTTWAGLGYKGVTANIGAAIFSSRPGSTAFATPIKFALSGPDPISHQTVRSYTTVPIGAAPIVFVANNSGGTPFALDLAAHITVTAATDKPAAHLFDGTTACAENNPAFSGGALPATALTLFLREPLSGTMNTTEFTTFRSAHNNHDSQEVGVINPLTPPYNPLNLACAGGGGGSRQRAIGTGEVRDAVKNTANSLGYLFFGFANLKTYGGAATYNYLTLDGVDPIFASPTGNQTVPNCTATNCPAVNITGTNSFWGSSTTPNSFPNLRNGKYKAWSIYRWLVDNSDADPYGPTALAQSTQDTVDTSVADFVPFTTSDLSDGLDVYRSHFTQATKTGNNGNASPMSSLGNTLGGGPEQGGDEGGLIEGPFGVSVTASGTASTSGVADKTGADTGFYPVLWKSGDLFQTIWVGNSITFNGATFTVHAVTTTKKLYVVQNPGKHNVAPFPAFSETYTTGAASPPGIINKKQ